MASLDISPSKCRPNADRLTTFILNGGTWSVAPTLTPSGVAGVSIGTVTLINPTTATATVTYGANTGTVSWTDGTNTPRNQIVTQTIPRLVTRSRF